jgi:hypothetical protein
MSWGELPGAGDEPMAGRERVHRTVEYLLVVWEEVRAAQLAAALALRGPALVLCASLGSKEVTRCLPLRQPTPDSLTD